MIPGADSTRASGLAALRRFVLKPPLEERCDLCSIRLSEQHQHLIEPQTRRLVCTCDACAILFGSGGETQYRRVPRDAEYLRNFQISDQLWNSLAIPIGLVFFYRSAAPDKVTAVYPSPAGPTEVLLDFESWEEIAQENPVLRKMGLEVEALLVNRMQGQREYYLAPIDECYKLTGLIRKHWHGFSGGSEAWEQIGNFFDTLKERCGAAPVTSDARSHV